jgi:hypothetical protein
MRERKIRKMEWVSELKGLNLELRVQIHLQLYPTIQRQLERIFWFFSVNWREFICIC